MISPVNLVTQLGQLGTVSLLIALVLLFVVAFKVLEMVMQTVLVAALSGGFYLALAYYLPQVSFSLNSLLFFTFLGGTLYTGYHLLAQGYSLLTLLMSIPVKLLRSIYTVLKSLQRKIKNSREPEA